MPLEFKYRDGWNAYVNATLAFLEQDKPALKRIILKLPLVT